MDYDFSKFKKRGEEIKTWFKNELSLIRTGRASPALVENIKVDYYGTKTPLKSIATISTEDAKTLRIKPWDKETIIQIEQAIQGSSLGIQTINEKDSLRVVFPQLTEERRNSLLKLLSQKLEEARISLRRERKEIWRDIQNLEEQSKISQDDKYRFKDKLQELTEEFIKDLEEIAQKKEEEIKR